MAGLEPLVAVSFASNILQFVHTTRKLIETTRELFDNGAKTEHLELEAIARDLRIHLDEISIPLALAEHDQITDNQNAFEPLAQQCRQLTEELLAVLKDLKQHGNSKKFTSFAQALRTLWHEPQIEALRRRLNAIAQAVQARLGEKSAASLQVQFDKLLDQNREMEISRAADIERLYQSFSVALQNSQKRRKEGDHFDEDLLAIQMNSVALESMHYSVEQKMLLQLRFPRIEDRYSSISPAHEKTLTWLFGDTSPATFTQWLDSDNDLYWISGLPGSGKSTLIKFLCTHALTLGHLARWAEDDQVIVAEYFFWNAGKNDLQKSQEGLLRPLLYQILRKCPSYIRQVFRGPWSLYNGGDDTVDSMTDVPAEVPSDVSGLKQALHRTCAMLAECNQRFCFFIDGLDKYKGKPMEIIDLIDVLRALVHVKICVSSRPWEDFEDAYGSAKMSKLLMERFNDRDIVAYVEDKFAKDMKYSELKDVETRGEALVKDIVTSTNGVFLWVILFVQSLQEGLRKGDGIKRLEDRLRSLPSDLEELFERILFQHVDPVDRGRAACMFLVTLRAKENLPFDGLLVPRRGGSSSEA